MPRTSTRDAIYPHSFPALTFFCSLCPLLPWSHWPPFLLGTCAHSSWVPLPVMLLRAIPSLTPRPSSGLCSDVTFSVSLTMITVFKAATYLPPAPRPSQFFLSCIAVPSPQLLSLFKNSFTGGYLCNIKFTHSIEVQFQ